MRVYINDTESVEIRDYTYDHKVVGIEVCVSGLDPVLSVELNTISFKLANIVFHVAEFPLTRAGILEAGALAHKLSRHFQVQINQRITLSI